MVIIVMISVILLFSILRTNLFDLRVIFLLQVGKKWA